MLLLRQHGRLSATTARELEVSTRTVLRDIDRATLRLLAAPLGDVVAGQAEELVPALASAGAGAGPCRPASRRSTRGPGGGGRP